jgi:Spo0E like sporulation regulatory protein
MQSLKEDILNFEIEYQKRKMYRLSVQYGISSVEVLEQSKVVDILINRVMRRKLKSSVYSNLVFS